MSRSSSTSSSSHPSLIPARLDRLAWSGFHWRVMIALGVTWILDGLEVTFMGAVSGVLENPGTLGLSPSSIGLLGSAYVTGAVGGSLLFGYLADVMGRKRLFFVTLGVYIFGVFLSAFAWNLGSFMLFRFLTGAGIGGEYAAINSAIDELVPARVRGRVGLTLNGTYWLGAAVGSASTFWLLNPQLFDVDLGWRIGFAIGAIGGLIILFFREFVPESPRWLLLRGRDREADIIVSQMEKLSPVSLAPCSSELAVMIRPQPPVGLSVILSTMFSKYRQRSLLGLSLMTSQAFLYNAVFFTYALILTRFYQVQPQYTGLYIIPFALGNFLGPLVLGHLFDTIGRRKMITFTYAISGVLLAVTGFLFAQGLLTAVTQVLAWSLIFFFASAAASSAYLTVSEIFPLETRAIAIAIFYSLGTGMGGVVAPWLFGVLTESGSATAVMYGYLLAAFLMLGGALSEWKWGLDCEGQSLESIASPLGAEAPLR